MIQDDDKLPEKISLIIYDDKLIASFPDKERLPDNLKWVIYCMSRRSPETPTQQPITKKLFIAGIVTVAILILISIGLTFYLTSNLNNKIEIVNNLLNAESETHFIEVQKTTANSVVEVISSPINNNGGSNNVIYLDNKGQAWNMGTGFSIDNKGHILTANHVIQNANTVMVLYTDGLTTKTIPVNGIKSSSDLDLAILYTNSSIPPVTIQGGNIQDMNSYLGASVAFIGYPFSTTLNGVNHPVETTTRGSISALIPFTYKNQQVPVYVIGANANRGNSGGPVFSLKTGQVIGIINEKSEGTEGIAISTAINQDLITQAMNA